jgi:hypothetical protein
MNRNRARPFYTGFRTPPRLVCQTAVRLRQETMPPFTESAGPIARAKPAGLMPGARGQDNRFRGSRLRTARSIMTKEPIRAFGTSRPGTAQARRVGPKAEPRRRSAGRGATRRLDPVQLNSAVQRLDKRLDTATATVLQSYDNGAVNWANPCVWTGCAHAFGMKSAQSGSDGPAAASDIIMALDTGRTAVAMLLAQVSQWGRCRCTLWGPDRVLRRLSTAGCR